MDSLRTLSGVNIDALAEAFTQSEDVLSQMLTLFLLQVPERLAEIDSGLNSDHEIARKALHSMVNIAGAIRAYGLAELAKHVGESLKLGDEALARSQAEDLRREAAYVQVQVRGMLEALAVEPKHLWLTRFTL
jgi:hypothetical protein